MKNCTWSSCREGCTNAQTKCHQMTVNYTKISYKEWVKKPLDLELVDWDVAETKFLINPEGCGYPPFVNCTEFAKKHGYVGMNSPFHINDFFHIPYLKL